MSIGLESLITILCLFIIIPFAWSRFKLRVKWANLRGIKNLPIENLPHTEVPNDKIITIKDARAAGLKIALQKFCAMYDKEELEAIIKLHDLGNNIYALTFPYNINFGIFCFLVNFLHYPDAGDTAEHGQILAWANVDDKTQAAYGQNAMFFIPQWDEEHDNCYCVTDYGRYYKIPFTDLKMGETIITTNYSYERCPYKYEYIIQTPVELVF